MRYKARRCAGAIRVFTPRRESALCRRLDRLSARVGMRVVWSIRARRAFVVRLIHLRRRARASIIKLRARSRRERGRTEAT